MVKPEPKNNIAGIIPAAGLGSRVAPLPCSKEIYPVGFSSSGKDGQRRPKAVSEYLIESFQRAGIKLIYIVIRDGKWDIPAYLGNGSRWNVNFAYVMMGLPYGAPFSIDQAYPFVKDNITAFGYPDIIFQPSDVYIKLLSNLDKTHADAVLGLFPTDTPEKMDMVDIAPGGGIRKIVIKPEKTELRYAWICAVWRPEFSYFMHNYLKKIQNRFNKQSQQAGGTIPVEYYLGNVFQEALKQGYVFNTEIFYDGFTLDIGTKKDLLKAVSMYN